MPLHPPTVNALQCWLYDKIYQHLPRNKVPNVASLQDQVLTLGKVDLVTGIPFHEVHNQIAKDIKSGTWKDPPTPENARIAQRFPKWRQWHATLTASSQSSSSQSTPSALHSVQDAEGERVWGNKQKVHKFRDTGYSQRVLIVDVETKTPASSNWDTYLNGPGSSSSLDSFEGGRKNKQKTLLQTSRSWFSEDAEGEPNMQKTADEALKYAPLFASDILTISDNGTPQFAIFAKAGETLETSKYGEDAGQVENDILFLNVNTPWTTFICGLQGAGKSHSLSVILVFSYSPYSPTDTGKPCEVAYLSVPDNTRSDPTTEQSICSARKVTILVSRSNLVNMERVYNRIPGVTVKPLLFKPSQLTITTMLQLMSVGQDNTSLYLQVVNRILRDMAAEGAGGFDYESFKRQLEQQNFTPQQWGPLDIRLELLESFIGAEQNPSLFAPDEGTVTIIDLTCPFVDAETACALFSICLDLFTVAPATTGKIVALDEAHKFMSGKTYCQRFSDSIIQNMRRQRHFGIRTIISTQDPQVHPELLELSNFIIMHRFDSPRWFDTLKHHVGFQGDSGDAKASWDEDKNARSSKAFENIMHLNTGEAYIYCPQMAMLEGGYWGEKVTKLGNRLLKIRVRRRLTADGGASINVV
ncbi:hypothetical protein ABW19_dt0201093 [Dactylella cylindrospora]|nr:hypothetical protein ABW19_dt0201093 [Dactylella cylindrospora]